MQKYTYIDESPSTVFRATNTSTNPLTRSSSMMRRIFAFVSVALLTFFVKSPFTTDTHIVSPLPAFNCDANENSLRYFGRFSSVGFTRINNCGRQFLVCGSASSKRSNAYRAAVNDIPRIPSPHSFSALHKCRQQHKRSEERKTTRKKCRKKSNGNKRL